MNDHFSSSDEDLEEFLQVLERPKNLNYFEETVPQYNEEQYVKHIRMSREKVAYLAERYQNSKYFNYQEGDSLKTSALKIMTIFLWYAGHEAVGFRDVADRFDVSISSLPKVIKRVSYFLSNLSPEFIRWPDANEKIEIERHFRQNNFPHVIGVIDGTHIRIDKPTDDPDSYLNRKHYFSIQAQIVCDHKRKIRDIFVGYPGSVHDSRVFRNSILSQTLAEKCGDLYIIGDSGYPCLQHLLVPFRDRGQLSRRQRNFNYILSKNRYIVKHCFGLLKQKFRQLYHLKLRDIPQMVYFIRACAVLHNICITDEDMDNEVLNDGNLLDENLDVHDHDVNADEQLGVQRRDVVMNTLPFILR